MVCFLSRVVFLVVKLLLGEAGHDLERAMQRPNLCHDEVGVNANGAEIFHRRRAQVDLQGWEITI
jgi:hypothetical protein